MSALLQVCMKLSRYTTLLYMLEVVDFFRPSQTPTSSNHRDLVAQTATFKFHALKIVLDAVKVELTAPEVALSAIEEIRNTGKRILCKVGLLVLTELLEDWKRGNSGVLKISTCIFMRNKGKNIALLCH